MATEILKKQTIVGTDAQYEANRNSYEEGTVFESTSLLGENDIDPTYTNKFVAKRTTADGVYLYAYDSTGDISQAVDTVPTEGSQNLITSGAVYSAIVQTLNTEV